MLAGFLFFKKFIDNQKILYSIVSATFLVFGYMLRHDVVLVIIPLFFFLVLTVIFQKTWTLTSIIHKIKKIVSFTLPLILGYEFDKTIEAMRYSVESTRTMAAETVALATKFGGLGFMQTSWQEIYGTGAFGLLFSPGVGLFIYVPILLTVFFSFPDFFRKNKIFTVLLLVIPSIYIIQFGSMNAWQGWDCMVSKISLCYNSISIITFSASIEKRGRKILPIICILGCIGFFFNFVNIIQDVSWFVWSHPGASFTGLMGLALDTGRSCALYICPEVTWTFQYSPLTNSIYLALSNLYPDLFLLKLFGIQYYILTLVSVLSAEFYLLYRILKPKIKHSIDIN